MKSRVRRCLDGVTHLAAALCLLACTHVTTTTLPSPAYPAMLAASGVEGEAVLRLYWGAGGRPDTTRTLQRRATHPAFFASARAALHALDRLPGTRDSVDVTV